MISVVCVYNNKDMLNDILLSGLNKQNVEVEKILIDNTDGKFKSAADALNYGGQKATGKYVMFIHQDVELEDINWIGKIEEKLNWNRIDIAGVTGKTNIGYHVGKINSVGQDVGEEVKEITEVQTLDECVIIVSKRLFGKLKFDAKVFDGWHCYGADYCLSANEIGIKSYVIPTYIYHRSRLQNVDRLTEYWQRLYKKHKILHTAIYMTSGPGINRLVTTLAPVYRQYVKWFPTWLEDLRNELADCETVLDLGCGYNSPIQTCKNLKYTVGVDGFKPYLEESKKKRIHNEYVESDLRKVEFKKKSFDAVVMCEVLEHMNKEEGRIMIEKTQEWARKKIVITTPNGYVWQDGYDNNPYQEHLSGWTYNELKMMGFRLTGMSGLKWLHGYKGKTTIKPMILGLVLSDISQKLLTHRVMPSIAFQLIGVKDIK